MLLSGEVLGSCFDEKGSAGMSISEGDTGDP